MYQNRVEAFHGVMDYINSSSSEYLLAADCDYVANCDLSEFMESHVKSGADISLLYKKMEIPGDGGKDVSTFMLDKDSNVIDMLIHPQITGEQNVYLNVIFTTKQLLERAIRDCRSRNLMSFDRDVLQAGIGKYKIRAHEHKGYAGRFDSMKAFYRTNMDYLRTDVRRSLFPADRPVYTKIRDEAPVRYGLDSKINNSVLGDGCIIEGQVENSILFRGVTVGKGAKVKNCILMQGTKVGVDSSLDCVITDKNVTVAENRTVMGFSTYPVYISKGSSV
jgi:glucose-1-phosphate adenylyltransferase